MGQQVPHNLTYMRHLNVDLIESEGTKDLTKGCKVIAGRAEQKTVDYD